MEKAFDSSPQFFSSELVQSSAHFLSVDLPLPDVDTICKLKSFEFEGDHPDTEQVGEELPNFGHSVTIG